MCRLSSGQDTVSQAHDLSFGGGRGGQVNLAIAASRGPLRGKAGEPVFSRAGSDLSSNPLRQLHQLSKSGHIPHAHRGAVGQFETTVSRAVVVRYLEWTCADVDVTRGVCTQAQVKIDSL